MAKVPVQKGKIISNPPTMKSTPYPEKVREAEQERRERKSGQTLDYHSPSKRK